MPRGAFREIDHTADVGLDLEGPCPAAILEAAQRGLVSLLLTDTPDLEPNAERRIEVAAEGYPELLKVWCERLYRLLEEDAFVPLAVDVDAVGPDHCRARIRGARLAPDRRRAVAELKAVTYHQLAFGPAPAAGGGPAWRARVIFDV